MAALAMCGAAVDGGKLTGLVDDLRNRRTKMTRGQTIENCIDDASRLICPGPLYPFGFQCLFDVEHICGGEGKDSPRLTLRLMVGRELGRATRRRLVLSECGAFGPSQICDAFRHR